MRSEMDIEEKWVCYECVAEELLSAEIQTAGVTANCDYCGIKDIKCTTVGELALRIDVRYRELVSLVEMTPYFEGDSDRVSYRSNGETPTELITDLIVAADEQISIDIVDYLGDYHGIEIAKDGGTDWYDDSSNIFRITIPRSQQFHFEWEQFCESLKHHRRYFSDDAEGVLARILGPIISGTNPIFASAIRLIGPESEDRFIYRARVANDEGTLVRICSSPIRELGAPPPHAATAGRMNAHGISVFYGSSDAKTCIAELRTPLSGTAVVGRFEIIRPLRILDLTKLRQIHADLSLFHPDLIEAEAYARFIRGFHDQIKRPVIPGRELLDYLPTQVVAEFLWTRKIDAIDGLIFGSSQLSGDHTNIVLFPSASSVQGVNDEAPKEITSTFRHGGHSGDDDDDSDYENFFSQSVWFRPPQPRVNVETFAPKGLHSWMDPAPTESIYSLRLLEQELSITSVESIDYSIRQIPVEFYEERPDSSEAPF